MSAESHWVCWRLGLLVSNQYVVGLSGSVGLLELWGRGVAEVAVEALGVVVGIADRADRGHRAGFGEAFTPAQRRELAGFNRSSQHLDDGGVRWR